MSWNTEEVDKIGLEDQIRSGTLSREGHALFQEIMTSSLRARGLLYSPDADDIRQEVYIQAHTELGQKEIEPGTFAFWLLSLAKYRCLTHHRDAGKRRYVSVEEYDDHTPEQLYDDPTLTRANRATIAEINEAIPNLTRKSRRVMELYSLDYSAKEIAAHLGIDEATVRSHKRHAVSRLKRLLDK
ncbi:MAG: RNA polymerase sigma factor [Candidatus Woesearchaeota archaeon]|nr:RNA polymerase sigma factor [Candidatus Woesearchaeota archaeon]